MYRIFVSIGLIFALAASHAATLEYDWLTIGELSGRQIVTITETGERRVEFEFNDRGRGPKITSLVRLNDQGIPVYLRVTGVNYTKAEVDETFIAENGRAQWQSSIEQGDEPFSGDAFYLPESWFPEYTAMLARALLDDTDGVLPLLPSGQARIEQIRTLRLDSSDDHQEITLYAITGLDLMPTYVWLDENRELFGVDYGWFGIIRSGYAQHIDMLKEIQNSHTDIFIHEFSDAVRQPVEKLLVIHNAQLFDPVTGEVIPNSTVFILDGRITAVYNTAIELPEQAQIIDAQGKFLMPALWDMHAHIQPGSYFNYIAMGVTNVRDMANDPDYIVQARRDIEAGKIAAPNIHAMGFIDKQSPFAAPTGKLAENLDQAIGFVDFYAQKGFRGIKLYSSIEPAWVKPIVDHAHGLGLSVLGHIPSGMNAEDAVSVGFNEITHVNMILLNFLGARSIDTRTPKRFTEVGERAHTIDLHDESVINFIGLMIENNVAHDPTLSIFQDMFYNDPGEISIIFRSITEHLPALVQREMISSKSFNDGHEEHYERAGELSRDLIAMLHKRGIRLLPGTDNALPGMTLIRELLFYAESGITNAEVLRLATLEPALHLGLEHEYGTISQGKRAHLILIEGNPVQNLADLYKVDTVIKDDNIYKSAEILVRQGFRPFN